ncbi:uncharacterized protein SOCEGT47_068470 [Sorangium cellulosum]|uniref:Uncharacterized protein n=2 Tax=Sorangium cellulosum TaxID=56 RepID=A0A4P2QAJ1_SORCE|nr:uncharacterized protein SOCEGT47_068470 [Sorangium cellulosum]
MGTADFGAGPTQLVGFEDPFVATYTDDGALRWVRRFRGRQATVAGVVVDGNDGIAVVGHYARGPLEAGDLVLEEPERDDPVVASSDIFVLALDRDGAPRWMHRLGGGGFDRGGLVAVGPGNDVVVAGHSAGRLTLARFAADGTPRFSTDVGTLNGLDDEIIHGLAVDLHGDILVAGSFSDNADLGGGAILGLKGNQAWVAKYSGEDGAHLWSRHFGTPRDLGSSGGDLAKALIVDEHGDVLVAGQFAQGADLGEGPFDDILRGAFLMKLAGEDGAIRWAKALPTFMVRSTSLSFAPDGRVALIASFGAPPDLGGGALDEPGTYVAIYEPDTGALVAQRRLVELGSEIGVSGRPAVSALDTKGHLSLVVTFSLQLPTGFGSLKSRGWTDILLAHLPL